MESRCQLLYVMIPAALLIVAIAIYIFFWAVDSGQYDDLDGPAHSVLFDDQDPNAPGRHRRSQRSGTTAQRPTSCLNRRRCWSRR